MILDRILEAKRAEVDAARASVSEAALAEREEWTLPRRGFARALREGPRPRIIAEIKHRSPSRGVIRTAFDPATHAREYDDAGAACISVLTDAPFFGGSLEHLGAARAACERPLLRKDFTIDAYQIAEARAWGADAVLLIVAALEREAMRDLLTCAADQGLDALVEVHDRPELDVALEIGADLVGINNRNLHTFETTTDVTRRLAPAAGDSVTLVSESGLGDAAELAELSGLGVDAFLIGETFMAAEHPGRALAGLLRP